MTGSKDENIFLAGSPGVLPNDSFLKPEGPACERGFPAASPPCRPVIPYAPGGTRPPRPGVGAQGPALPPPQPPPLELPEGCRGPAAGVQVAYRVRLRMLSCPCQPHAARTLRLPRTLLLSGAAYDLAVVSRTRLGHGPNRTWHIPAAERPGAGSRARGAARASSRFGLRAAAAQAAGFCK